MKFFQEQTLYNINTGEPYTEEVQAGIICDFCGKIHRFGDADDDWGYEFSAENQIEYRIYDYESIEQSYYYDPTIEGISPFDLMALHEYFYYCQDYEYAEPKCEPEMLKTASEYSRISNMMYAHRYRVMRELLESGKVTKQELGFEDEQLSGHTGPSSVSWEGKKPDETDKW